MILIITSRDDATADFVTARLRRSEYVRLDSEDLPSGVKVECSEKFAAIVIGRKKWAPMDFSGIWYRRPKAITFSGAADKAEAQHAAAEYTAALEGFLALVPSEKWINLPSRNVLAGHKPEQIRRAKNLGFLLPRTLITQDGSRLRKFWKECRGNVIVKPLSSGYIERETPSEDSLIYTNQLKEEDLECDEEIARCPTLFQERISKTADIRITVVDNEIEAVELMAN
ncbi:MAG TPA: hypothetical protein VKC60_01310, partial [Opitutaceae bacterium]|nr:hypothetical protein [Opitutaceae bacterium]